ncbi:MAG: hypothetical protein HYX26_10920 [Acidobacteriales bacterium]|nr:hypothetical protein [Terriglobales bacterium]
MAASATLNLTEIAAKWRAARRLYPIYAMLAREHSLGGPCRDLESPINRSEPDILQRIARWFEAMDDKIQVWQMRQLLQTTKLGSEENLRALLMRHLEKSKKSRDLRDKVDYLFVQYYAHCAPEDAHNTKIEFDHVAEVLYHAVGEVKPDLPSACADIEPLLADLASCRDLADLLGKKILDRAREIKDKVGDDYFKPSVLVAFARMNYILRSAFFRLIHADLHAVRLALHEMEGRGQQSCDCTSAGLAQEQPISELRRMCHDWKKPFRAAYAAGQSFTHLVAIRQAVESAAKRPLPAPPPVQAPVPQQVAAPVEPPPTLKAAPRPSPAPAPSVDSNEIENALEVIAEQLLNVPAGTKAVSNVVIGRTKLLLASWEVAAFTRGGDEVSDSLQRAVAARAILSAAMERKQKGEAVDLKSATGLAHGEAAQMQERIAEAKDAKNIDAAVNLAATAKRLLALIAESEKS